MTARTLVSTLLTTMLAAAAPVGSVAALGALQGCAADDGAADDEAVDESEDAITANARRARTEKLYADPVIARMYQVGHKTVGAKGAAEVAKALASRSPSVVSGLVRIDDDADLSENDAALADFAAVRRLMHGVAFDVVLNACQYRTADALTKHMQAINAKLGDLRPEAWFFDFYDTPLRDRDGDCPARGPGAAAMLRATAAWAHRHNQLIGGNVWQAADVPAGADFLAVPDEKGIGSMMDLVNRLPDRVVRLTHIENNPQKCWGSDLDDPRHPTKARCRDSSGEKYIWRTQPEDRKKYDEAAALASHRGDAQYMRPVFFPLSYHLGGGEKSQAFDRRTNAPASELPYVASPP